MVDKKNLESSIYRLKDQTSLKKLFVDLNYDNADEPVNKENWNEGLKEKIDVARIIAKIGDFRIFYIKNSECTLRELKEISTKIISKYDGRAMVCSQISSEQNWIISSLSKDFSKNFKETRHFQFEIKSNKGVLVSIIEFFSNVSIDNENSIQIIKKVSKAFDNFALEIHDELTVNVFEAFKILSEGIIDDKNNNLTKTNENLEEIRSHVFTFLYRLIFVLFVEDRNVFPLDNKTYFEKFSFRWIKQNLLLKSSSNLNLKEYEVQDRIKYLFHLIEVGSQALDYSQDDLNMRSYYGRLFDRNIHKKLESWKISNKHLLDVLSYMTRTRDSKGNYFFLDYSVLETRHLGSIYEHLLEYHLTVKNKKIIDLPNPKDRKTSASYYTPTYIVEKIVKDTIEPQIEKIVSEHSEKNTQIEKILKLKIIDPAMGSGHFLIGVVNYLAQKLCEIQYGEIRENELIEKKREVVRHCIYGVDLNPLAVDLASVALWLETLSSDKPLSFLQAHLKNGNSLLGSEIEQIYDKQTTLIEAEKGRSYFKKSVKEFLMFEELEDDDDSAVKVKIKKYKKMQSQGTIYYDLKFLLDCKIAKNFGISIPSVGDYRAKIGENSLDFYSSDEGSKIKDLSKQYRFFHWELEFPEIFYDEVGNKKSEAGFDVVIGNPPYLSSILLTKLVGKDVKKIWKEKFVSALGAYDVYVLFFEAGLKILKRDHCIGFITPNKYLSSPYGKGLRDLISKEFSLLEITDFSRINVFNDPSVYPIITIIQKTKSKYKYKIKTEQMNSDENNISHLVSSENLRNLPEFIWGPIINNSSLFIQKIFKKSEILSSVSEVQATSTAGEADLFSNFINEKTGIPIINTGTIDRYVTKYGISSLRNKGVSMKKPLLDISQINETRRVLYQKPKIIFAKLALRLEGYFDEEGKISSINTNCIHSPNTDYDLYYICGIMNSKLMSFIYFCLFNPLRMSKAYFQFQAPQLRLLPIISSQKYGDEVIEYVKEIIPLYDQLKHEKDSQKTMEKINELEEQIDEIVFKIYEVTKDEKEIINDYFN